MTIKPRLLFILKESSPYSAGDYTRDYISNNGLYNSAKFVVDMLVSRGVDAKLIQVFDSTFIDAEIVKYKPTVVVLEALWTTPDNLKILIDLHPTIKFLVRIHSETAFLVQEEIAISWINQYLALGVSVGFNSFRTADYFQRLLPGQDILFSPDFYPVEPLGQYTLKHPTKNAWDIGCFGALRLMKNQLNQAIAARLFARVTGKPVRFHINVDFHGDTSGIKILDNLRALFSGSPDQLVEHVWENEAVFTTLLNKMDIAMQVSLSESFNLVAAEAASLRIPIVTSDEVSWASRHSKALPTSILDIMSKLQDSKNGKYVDESISGLLEYDRISTLVWLRYSTESVES